MEVVEDREIFRGVQDRGKDERGVLRFSSMLLGDPSA